MKLSIVLLLAITLNLHANVNSQPARFTLDFSGKTVREVFTLLEEQSSFRFFYNEDFRCIDKKVEVNAKNETVEQILDKMFEKSDITYRMLDNNLVVLTIKQNPLAQQTKISGIVTDAANGMALPGVNIMVEGTTDGIITDFDGKFTVNVPNTNSVLVFSFVGYKTQKVTVGNQTSINIGLEADVRNIDEVVVVGYGFVKQSDLTGSVSSVKSDDLKKLAMTSFDQGIQGRAAGVMVTQASSAPGGRVTIRVRGGNSLSSGNEPLYVIDGYPVTAGATPGGNGAGQNSLASINPSDIESIEILKDASSTAIYGARGANGVVLITTKRGKTGETRVSYDGYYGVQSVAKKLDMLNAREFAELVNEANVNDGKAVVFPTANNPLFPSLDNIGEGFDYQDAIFRDAPITSHNLTITGGNQNTQFAISGGFFAQDGVVMNSDFQRGSLRTNIDAKISNKMKISTSLFASHVWGNIGKSEGDGGSSSGIINGALVMPSTVPYKDANGNLVLDNPTPGGSTIGNPYLTALYATDNQTLDRILGTTDLSYQIIDGLTLKISLGTDMSNGNRYMYDPKTTSTGYKANGSASQSNRTDRSYLNENTISYNKEFGLHSINAVAGYTWQITTAQAFTASGSSYTTDIYTADNLDAAAVYGTPDSWKNKNQLVSWLGRVNYSYNSKYLLTLTGRADGSSKFGVNNKWAFFPSVAVGWRVSEESFMKDISFLNNFKIRASYGITGNQNIASYRSLAQLGVMNYALGGVLASGLGPNNIPNPDLKWETTKVTDIGLDLGIFDNRLTLTADYYAKETTDLLWNFSIPTATGFGSIFKNVGSLENKGFELGLGSDVFVGTFKWNTQINWATNKNKVIDIEGFSPAYQGSLSGHLKINGSWLEPGLPVGVWNLLKYDGVFNDQAELESSAKASTKDGLGDPKFVDKNKDGKITVADDRMIVGDPNPDFIFGWSNNFNYKGFDLSIYMQGTYGNDVLNIMRAENNVSGPWASQRSEIRDRWTTTNTTSNIPKAHVAVNPSILQSSWLIEDGSYLRVKTITLGYTFNKLKSLSSVRIYLSGQNMLTFTNYSGFDPEVNSQGNSNLQLGVDYNAYPAAKIMMGGINIVF